MEKRNMEEDVKIFCKDCINYCKNYYINRYRDLPFYICKRYIRYKIDPVTGKKKYYLKTIKYKEKRLKNIYYKPTCYDLNKKFNCKYYKPKKYKMYWQKFFNNRKYVLRTNSYLTFLHFI